MSYPLFINIGLVLEIRASLSGSPESKPLSSYSSFELRHFQEFFEADEPRDDGAFQFILDALQKEFRRRGEPNPS